MTNGSLQKQLADVWKQKTNSEDFVSCHTSLVDEQRVKEFVENDLLEDDLDYVEILSIRNKYTETLIKTDNKEDVGEVG